MFTIDGMLWNVPCKIDRTAEIKASEISGMLLNKQYFNDVIGTYLSFDISLAVPRNRVPDYTKLYEILTDPDDAHTITVPYNEGTITITGRVEQVKDTFIRVNKVSNYWHGISFSFISNAPTKTHTLGEVISRGISPLPDISGAKAGDLYEFNGTAWVLADFEDVDDKAF